MTFTQAARVDRTDRKTASLLGVYEYLHNQDRSNFHYTYALLERYAALNMIDRIQDNFRHLIQSFYRQNITREQVVTAARFVARQLKKRKHNNSLSEFKHFLWRESQEIAAAASVHIATV